MNQSTTSRPKNKRGNLASSAGARESASIELHERSSRSRRGAVCDVATQRYKIRRGYSTHNPSPRPPHTVYPSPPVHPDLPATPPTPPSDADNNTTQETPPPTNTTPQSRSACPDSGLSQAGSWSRKVVAPGKRPNKNQSADLSSPAPRNSNNQQVIPGGVIEQRCPLNLTT